MTTSSHYKEVFKASVLLLFACKGTAFPRGPFVVHDNLLVQLLVRLPAVQFNYSIRFLKKHIHPACLYLLAS